MLLQDVCHTNLAARARALAVSPCIPVRRFEAWQAAEALTDDVPLSRLAVEAFPG